MIYNTVQETKPINIFVGRKGSITSNEASLPTHKYIIRFSLPGFAVSHTILYIKLVTGFAAYHRQ